MLDLSPQNPVPVLDRSSFASFRTIGIAKANELFAKWLIAICILVLLGMFLPWTQNIRARGT